MRQGLLTLALVGALCLGLTSCGMRNDQPDPNAGNNNSAANGGSDTAGSNSVTGGGSGSAANDTGSGGNGNADTNNGDVGDINNDAIGNADAGTNDNSNTQAQPQTRRASDLHRSAYDYLNDGRYRTSQTGNVIPRQGSMGIDMTQSVRDLIDDAKQLSREMMRSDGNINAPGTDKRS